MIPASELSGIHFPIKELFLSLHLENTLRDHSCHLDKIKQNGLLSGHFSLLAPSSGTASYSLALHSSFSGHSESLSLMTSFLFLSSGTFFNFIWDLLFTPTTLLHFQGGSVPAAQVCDRCLSMCSPPTRHCSYQGAALYYDWF